MARSRACPSLKPPYPFSHVLRSHPRHPPYTHTRTCRKPERLHYLGVSYGLTQQLFNFWSRAGFRPVYLRQGASETTGENTVVMLRPLDHPQVKGTAWLDPFVADFKVGGEADRCLGRKALWVDVISLYYDSYGSVHPCHTLKEHPKETSRSHSGSPVYWG